MDSFGFCTLCALIMVVQYIDVGIQIASGIYLASLVKLANGSTREDENLVRMGITSFP